MRMLWDLHPKLPYYAAAPWPVIEQNGQPDWIASVAYVEDWLELHVGHHWVHWTWNMWTLHQQDFCGVSFCRERDTTLFLLKFGP
jgi:hypothetical protein